MQVVSFWGDQKEMHSVEWGNVKWALASHSEGLAEPSSTNQLGPRQFTSTEKEHLALAGQAEGKEKGPTVASPGWKVALSSVTDSSLPEGPQTSYLPPGNPFKETAAHSCAVSTEGAAGQMWNILTELRSAQGFYIQLPQNWDNNAM